MGGEGKTLIEERGNGMGLQGKELKGGFVMSKVTGGYM